LIYTWRFYLKGLQLSNHTPELLIPAKRTLFASELTMKHAWLFIGISLCIRLLCFGWSDVLVEEAYYWNYGQHLDFGYLDHPPMVGLLIRISTEIFGTNELGVRMPAMLCWVLAGVFSFKWAELITRKTGVYALFLLSILPFFFLQSLAITPDQPLLVCWSASLYCLYRAAVLNETRYWFFAGIGIGVGMLSKYTIALLCPSMLLYLVITPDARVWLRRPAPYLAALLALMLFSPVIYWNATHDWASFAFQSSRRLNESFYFSTHHVIGLILFFLMPIGVISASALFKKKMVSAYEMQPRTAQFLRCFVVVPLCVFTWFSLMHPIKFNWIGPSLLTLLPWLALMIQRSTVPFYRANWRHTAQGLLIVYGVVMAVLLSGTPETVHRLFLKKFIAWEVLSEHMNDVAQHVKDETHTTPVFVPLDRYNIGSELAFYQAKLLSRGVIKEAYLVSGSHVFDGESLMYRYWSNPRDLSGKTLILISDNAAHFDNPSIETRVIRQSDVQSFDALSQKAGAPMRPFYYQVVQMK
jgi:dolichol-phosphate mannosyltransferase